MNSERIHDFKENMYLKKASELEKCLGIQKNHEFGKASPIRKLC